MQLFENPIDSHCQMVGSATQVMCGKFVTLVLLLGLCSSDATFVFSKLQSSQDRALNLEVAAIHGQTMGNNIEQVCSPVG